MNPNYYDKEDLNDLVLELKEKEINHLRQKVVTLSREVTRYPQEKKFLIHLNTSLIRLEQLLIA